MSSGSRPIRRNTDIYILSKDPDGKIISRSLGLGTLLDQLAAAVIIEASCPTLA
jgi:hypothetical protein